MKIKLIALLLAAALAAALTGCLGSGSGKDESSKDTDETDTEAADNFEYPVSAGGAVLESRPGIVVSLSPSVTEKLYDLGLEDRLDGISDYCDEPDGFGRARCGTSLTPDLDMIEGISPHLLLTDVELSDTTSAALHGMGVEVAVIPRASTAVDLKDNYANIARLMEGERTGSALGTAFNKSLGQRLDAIAAGALSTPKNAIYLRLLDFTVATGDTLENEMMELLGLNNIARDYTGWQYPEGDATSAGGKADFESLDFIFCDSRSVTIKMLENSEFYKGLNAVRKDYYLYIDNSAFERQTMRMLDELERMQEYITGGSAGGSMDESTGESAQDTITNDD